MLFLTLSRSAWAVLLATSYRPGGCVPRAGGWAGKCQKAFLTCLDSGSPSRDLSASPGLSTWPSSQPQARASHSLSGQADRLGLGLAVCGSDSTLCSQLDTVPAQEEGRVTCASGRRGSKYSVYLVPLVWFLGELINVLCYFPDVSCCFSFELEIPLNAYHIITWHLEKLWVA